MFSFAILIGIFSYVILDLGLLGILFKNTILITTLLFILLGFVFLRSSIKNFKELKLPKERLNILILATILAQVLINLIGALGPEYAFDALWYHLTIPKIYLLNHTIFHIPGNLLYYSDMPRFGEMLYTTALSLQNEILAKIIHFVFGILTAIALYKFSRKFFSQRFSLITVLLFYSNLVVAWESTTAYVDLFRTFFEIMAFWGFVNWWEKGERKWLVISSLMLGLAVSSKILAVGSLFIFTVLILYKSFADKRSSTFLITNILIYCCVSLFTALPWFVLSFVNTGSPIYPVFSNYYSPKFDIAIVNPINFFYSIWNLFTSSPDPVSPLYLIFIPLLLLLLKSQKKNEIVLLIYSILGIILWYLNPERESRFILPYLSVFSLLVGLIIYKLKFSKKLYFISIYLVILISFSSIVYRGVANLKFIPVIIGKESKAEFLEKHLNFSFGDFYDIDGYFQKQMTEDDKVLLYGFHNLYYVDFPFIDFSWVKNGDMFNYIAVQDATLPERFNNWNMIYNNPRTNVRLYSNNGFFSKF